MPSLGPEELVPELLSLGSDEIREKRLSGTGTLQEGEKEFGYAVRVLRLEEVPEVHRLHGEILRTLPSPLLLYERGEDFFAECMAGRGCVAGAFGEGRLIGYAAGWAPGDDPDNYGRDIGLEPGELGHVAHLAGSCIHPRYRGNRLHTCVVGMRTALLHAEGYHHQCGEVVPSNVRSIQNHFDGGYLLKGFRIDDFRFDAEGVPHYILHRDTRATPRRIDEADPPEYPIHDVEMYLEMMAAGRWGYRVRTLEGEALLSYGRFEP